MAQSRGGARYWCAVLAVLLSLGAAAVVSEIQLGQRNTALGVRLILSTIVTAQDNFRSFDRDGNGKNDYASDLAALGSAVAPDVAAGSSSGYRFKLHVPPDKAESVWMVVAEPISPDAGPWFFTSQLRQLASSPRPIAFTPDGQPPAGTDRMDFSGRHETSVGVSIFCYGLLPALIVAHLAGTIYARRARRS